MSYNLCTAQHATARARHRCSCCSCCEADVSFAVHCQLPPQDSPVAGIKGPQELRLQQDQQQLQVLKEHPADQEALAVLPALLVQRHKEAVELLLSQ